MTDKIIFFGTENFSALTLQQLLTDGYNIEAVVTKPDFKRGRGKALEEPLVKKIAQKNPFFDNLTNKELFFIKILSSDD